MKNTHKSLLRVIGLLIILATLTFGIGSTVLEGVFEELQHRESISGLENRLVVGALLEIACAIAVIAIGFLLYPVLRPYNEPVAIGYLAFRLIEGIILMVGVIGPLLLITLSEFSSVFIEFAIRSNQLAFHLAMLALGIYSIVLCGYLYKAKLLPRFIAFFGVVGYVALAVNSVIEFTGHSWDYTLFIPGALFEVAFPLWLIFKGMDFTFVESKRLEGLKQAVQK